MNWKDYFYFEKRDKSAIILLLILILLCGIVYLLVRENKQNIRTEEKTEYLTELGISEKERITVNRKKDTIRATYNSVKLKSGEFIELNSADTTNLKKIPGIGSAYANRIVKYRNSLGGYISVSQLHEIWGMDDDLYKKIEPYLTVKGSPKQLKINTLEFNQLKKHPYLNYKQVKVITDIRQRKGKIASINRLALLDEFTEKDINRLKDYLSFE